MRQKASVDAVACALDELGWHGRVVWAEAFFDRLLGMMKAKLWMDDGGPVILVFPQCRSVHTFGMGFPLDIAFADERGGVLAVYEGVAPGRVLAELGASFVVERPSVLEEGARVSAAHVLAA